MKNNALAELQRDWQREIRRRKIALAVYIALILIGMTALLVSNAQAARWTRIPIVIPLVPWLGPHLIVSVPVPW